MSASFHSWVDGERQNGVGIKELDKRATALLRFSKRGEMPGPSLYPFYTFRWEMEADLVPLHLEVI